MLLRFLSRGWSWPMTVFRFIYCFNWPRTDWTIMRVVGFVYLNQPYVLLSNRHRRTLCVWLTTIVGYYCIRAIGGASDGALGHRTCPLVFQQSFSSVHSRLNCANSWQRLCAVVFPILFTALLRVFFVCATNAVLCPSHQMLATPLNYFRLCSLKLVWAY